MVYYYKLVPNGLLLNKPDRINREPTPKRSHLKILDRPAVFGFIDPETPKTKTSASSKKSSRKIKVLRKFWPINLRNFWVCSGTATAATISDRRRVW